MTNEKNEIENNSPSPADSANSTQSATTPSDKIQALFNHLAPHYDQNNDIISLFSHRLIKYDVIRQLPELPQGAKILDLCTGTGDIAGILKKKYPNAEVTGLDFSEEMLNIAKNKHKNINFIFGDCLNLPFDNEAFDLVTISFGLRNTTNYDKTVSEISRVLRTNGSFIHLDFGKPEEEKFADKIFLEIVKFIAEFQEEESYIYLLQSRNNFPSPEVLIELFERHNLQLENRKDYLQGIISAQTCKKIYKQNPPV